jgi:hypothetical protein
MEFKKLVSQSKDSHSLLEVSQLGAMVLINLHKYFIF